MSEHCKIQPVIKDPWIYGSNYKPTVVSGVSSGKGPGTRGKSNDIMLKGPIPSLKK